MRGIVCSESMHTFYNKTHLEAKHLTLQDGETNRWMDV